MKWYECQECTEEFRVVSDGGAYVEYCPFCGAQIEEDIDEEDEDYDY